MNREITDIYKKDFFLDFGKQISQTRQRQGLDIDDVSEMTGMSKIKIKSIEKGCEERLLRLPLSCLLNICYALTRSRLSLCRICPQKKILTSCCQLDKGTPLSAHWLL